MPETLDRKDSHLAICLDPNERIEFYSRDANGFAGFRFEHDALPEVDYAGIQLETTLFGKTLRAPLIIGAMTGGTERATELNRRLAIAAERCGVGFALGSQRKMLEALKGDGKSRSALEESFQVRRIAPKVPLLFGNLGAVQLNYGVDARAVKELIERTGCDVFNFHLNPLQEAIQPEGDRNFAGLRARLAETIPQLSVPVVLKEVGAGISRVTARKLKDLGLAGVETAGVGGTSWSKIESRRAAGRPEESIGALFARWGTPTAESLIVCREELPSLVTIASGGLRNGIELAKAIALGAQAGAMALPFLKAAEISPDEVVNTIERVLGELRTAMFVTGMSSVAELREQGPRLLHRVYDQSGEGA